MDLLLFILSQFQPEGEKFMVESFSTPIQLMCPPVVKFTFLNSHRFISILYPFHAISVLLCVFYVLNLEPSVHLHQAECCKE